MYNLFMLNASWDMLRRSHTPSRFAKAPTTPSWESSSDEQRIRSRSSGVDLRSGADPLEGITVPTIGAPADKPYGDYKDPVSSGVKKEWIEAHIANLKTGGDRKSLESTKWKATPAQSVNWLIRAYGVAPRKNERVELYQYPLIYALNKAVRDTGQFINPFTGAGAAGVEASGPSRHDDPKLIEQAKKIMKKAKDERLELSTFIVGGRDLDSFYEYKKAFLEKLAGQTWRPTYDTVFEVKNKDSVVSAFEELEENPNADVIVDDFANGDTPGGGFLKGAKAQEENALRQVGGVYEELEANMDRKGGIPSLGAFVIKNAPIMYLDVNSDSKKFVEQSRPYKRVTIVANDAYRYTHEPQKPMLQGRAGTGKDVIAKRVAEGYRMPPPAYGTAQYKEETQAKIDAQFMAAIESNTDSRKPIVCIKGAFGSGAFNNHPLDIIPLLDNSINQFGKYCKKIVFAVLDMGDKEGKGARNVKIYTDYAKQRNAKRGSKPEQGRGDFQVGDRVEITGERLGDHRGSVVTVLEITSTGILIESPESLGYSYEVKPNEIKHIEKAAVPRGGYASEEEFGSFGDRGSRAPTKSSPFVPAFQSPYEVEQRGGREQTRSSAQQSGGARYQSHIATPQTPELQPWEHFAPRAPEPVSSFSPAHKFERFGEPRRAPEPTFSSSSSPWEQHRAPAPDYAEGFSWRAEPAKSSSSRGGYTEESKAPAPTKSSPYELGRSAQTTQPPSARVEERTGVRIPELPAQENRENAFSRYPQTPRTAENLTAKPSVSKKDPLAGILIVKEKPGLNGSSRMEKNMNYMILERLGDDKIKIMKPRNPDSTIIVNVDQVVPM